MLGELRAHIENISTPLDGPAVAELIACWDLLGARIAAAVGENETAGLHELDGATSMTAWLIHFGRMTRGGATKLAKHARLAAKLPDTARAWENGTLSGGQVEAICRNLDPETVELFARQEAELLPTLTDLSADDIATAMAAWKDAATADREPLPDRPQRLHLSRYLHNRWRLDGDLNAETGALLSRALQFAQTKDVEGEPARSVATRRADALADVCRYFLDTCGARRPGRERPHLNLIVDGDRLADHEPTPGHAPDGTLFDHRTVDRLLCDCSVHRVVVDGESSVLDYGRTTRTAPPPLWNALIVRDRHCRFPGCDRPPHWCEGHHIWHWEKGGPTDIDNLALFCVRHHHLLHQKGWEAKLLPDATVEITDPTGCVRTSRPPGTSRHCLVAAPGLVQRPPGDSLIYAVVTRAT